MINIKKFLPITPSVLFVGLKKGWLDTKEVQTMIVEYSKQLNCSEKTMIEININDDKNIVLEILRKEFKIEESSGEMGWQLAYLTYVEKSETSMNEKIYEIENLWANFDYPESWGSFIWDRNNYTTEKLYKNFLIFLDEERSKLIKNKM